MKKVGLMVLLVGILIEILSFSEAFSAGTFTVFGPKDYARTTGKPTTATDNFSVLNPNTSYTLHIYNGGKNNQFKGKVSSAVISLNGVDVVSPNEFNQNVFHIQKPITLAAGNALAVELRSKPESGLTIEIIGVDNDPPTIVATAIPSPNAAGWNNTDVRVSFVCSDTMSGIASCPGSILVQQEGADQVVTGTATDNSGNTASASVTVNLDKTPPIVAILSPAPGANLQDPSIMVQGTFNETLSGVAAITCNGVPATVSNSSFTCNVSLVTGQNTIQTAATDLAGNTGSSSITVAFVSPALELAYVDEFELVGFWSPWGPGTNASFYRPVISGGFYSLGHYVAEKTTGIHEGIPFGFVLVARELESGALASPLDYTRVYEERWVGTIWRPVPPQGYVCLGLVVQTGDSKPSTDEIRCVRQDLTVRAKVGNTIGFPDLSWWIPGLAVLPTWQIVPHDENGVFVGTFTGKYFPWGTYIFTPPTESLFTIDARMVKRYDLDAAAIDNMVQQYGPDLYFYWEYPGTNWRSREDYFLDDPEYVLDNGTTLVWGLVQNEWDYDSFSFNPLGTLNTSAAGLMQDVSSYVETNPQFGEPSFRQYLQIDDSFKPGNLDRAKALVRVRPWNWLFTDLQFWLFYPFNGPGRAEVCITGNDCVEDHFTQAGRHYGDWERVTLRIENRSQQLIAVYMSRHGGGQWLTRNLFPLEFQFNGSHPIIYAAKYSHANYQFPGVIDYERVYESHWFSATQSVDLRDLTSGEGEVFSTWLPDKSRIISSALSGYQVTEPEWLKFKGRWGQYERLVQDIYYIFRLYTDYSVGAGPTGPMMKSSWVFSDSGKNWWWTRNWEGHEACFDGIDNNGDGTIDCDDPECRDFDPICIRNQ